MKPDDKLLAQFAAIGQERLEVLNNGLLSLERDGGDADAVTRVMREIHTLKGEGRMLGLEGLSEVAHRTEDLLVRARDAGFDVSRELFDAIYSGLDCLTAMITASDGHDDDRATFLTLAAELLGGPETGARDAVDGPGGSMAGPGGVAEPTSSEPVTPPGRDTALDDGAEVLRVPLARVDDLSRRAADLLLRRSQIERIAHDLARLGDDWSDAIDRLQIGDRTNDAALTRLRAFVREQADRIRLLQDEDFELGQNAQELLDGLTDLRLLELRPVLTQFATAARRIAREHGKDVRVSTEGTRVTADKVVLERLQDALIHIVRNSIDHGIETPAARVAAGKPECGHIRLVARHSGGFVEVTVHDDGRGIDPTTVRRALAERGHMPAAEIDALSTKELFEILFKPGFSTRAEVSELSGRGVGLDVVRERIAEVGGSVHFDSQPGIGTEIALRMPISTAIADVLLVRISAGTFGIPSSSVESVHVVQRKDLVHAGHGTALRLEDGHVPLHDLDDLLGFSAGEARGEELPVFVARCDDGRVAVRVDRFLGERQVLHQAVNPLLGGLDIVTGTVTLDGDQLAALLDVQRLVSTRRRTPTGAVADEPSGDRRSTVLIAEDSDLTREMLVSVVSRLGYATVEAVNGQDALNKVAQSLPDLVVTDLDMPLLDGFGLIRELRSRPPSQAIPVIVVSTRDGEDARRAAAAAGANAYLVKKAFKESVLRELFDTVLRAASPAKG